MKIILIIWTKFLNSIVDVFNTIASNIDEYTFNLWWNYEKRNEDNKIIDYYYKLCVMLLLGDKKKD